jgi:hypothetical protein
VLREKNFEGTSSRNFERENTTPRENAFRA